MSDFIVFDEGAELLLHKKRIGTRILKDFAPGELLRMIWDGKVYTDRGVLLPRLAGGADFIGFNEGRIVVEDTGWPNTVYFDLSTGAIGSTLVATTAYASRLPTPGTSYTQKNQTQPTPTAATLGQLAFVQMSWATGSDTNWSNSVRTIIASDGSAKIICAWNLIAGGGVRDMSQANTTLNVTPTYLPTNPP